MSIRALRRALTLLLLTVACDDPASPGGGGPDVELPDPTGPVTATVTAAGGTLSATTGDGAVVTLHVPVGAVRSPTDITIRPVAADAGAWFGVELEPSGLRLLAPFDLKVVLPEGLDVVDPMLMLGGTVPLPTTWDAATRTLSTSALDGFAIPGDAAPSTMLHPSSSHFAPGNRIDGRSMSCSELTATSQQVFDSFVANEQFGSAVSAALSIGAMLQGQRCDPSAFIASAQRVACDRGQAAFDGVRDEPTTSYGDFARQARRIIAWAGLLQLMAADCGPLDDWSAAVEREIMDFLEFFRTRLDELSANDFATFLDLKKEALTLIELEGQAATLGLPDASQLVHTSALVPTLTRMREVGYDLCRSDGWHYPLSRLTQTGFFAGRDIIGVDAPREGDIPPSDLDAGFTDTDIFADIQYCATDLDVKSVVASGDTLASDHIGTEGTAGSHVAELTIATPTRGGLFIAGDLRAFTCWNDIEADTEVEISLNRAPALTLKRGDDVYVDSSGLYLDIAELADSAGITPQEGISHDLVFERKRSACHEGIWGDAEFELLTVTLDWVNPTLTVDIEFPDQVMPGAAEQIAVRVAVIDQMGTPAYFPDVDVDLSISGGTAAPMSGTTDDDGYFRTSVTAAEAGTPLTVRATATSFEGVSAEATHEAQVGNARVRYVESAYNAYGLAYVGWLRETDRDERADSSFAPSATVAADVSAAHDSAGTSGGTTTLTGDVALDGNGDLLSVRFNGQSRAWSNGTRGYPVGSAHSNGSITFEIIGGAATVRITGTIEAYPRRYGGVGNGAMGSARVWLLRLDPEGDGGSDEDVAIIDTNSSIEHAALDETLVLKPGVYLINAASGGSTSSRPDTEIEATSSTQVELTVQ